MQFICKIDTNNKTLLNYLNFFQICARGRIKIIDSVMADYTSCINSIGLPCRDELLDDFDTQCLCGIVDFTVNSTLAGDVMVFYQLESFNESSMYSETNYTLSRYF